MILFSRMSELEVENGKLRQDYQLLRNSIKRGVEHQELEGKKINEESLWSLAEYIYLRKIFKSND